MTIEALVLLTEFEFSGKTSSVCLVRSFSWLGCLPVTEEIHGFKSRTYRIFIEHLDKSTYSKIKLFIDYLQNSSKLLSTLYFALSSSG